MNNKNLFVLFGSIAVLMVLLSYAFVPLYSIFCKTTGYFGSVNTDSRPPLFVGKKILNIRFNSDVSPGLPWQFYPQRTTMKLQTGVLGLAFFYLENDTDEEFDGIAVYNVTPHKIAKYFKKVACFCFDKQFIPAKSKIVMPVSFFVDPKFELDEEVNHIDTMTLSYTFFKYE